MPNVQSINQNTLSDALPDFRNWGVILRSLLLVNGMVPLVAIAQASSWQNTLERLIDISIFLQPVLLLNLLLLFVLNFWLIRLPYKRGATVVVLLAMFVTLMIYYLGSRLNITTIDYGHFQAWRNALLSSVIAGLLLVYFQFRANALSPALDQARLQALQARIRPHFLFNSINAVLGIVRANPKRAETALEDMADLFRMAMAHDGDLVTVRQEVMLARQYLALEQLRLGERLQVNWYTDNMPDDALLPPLILQPLLENAVYHGIEPLAEGGIVEIKLYCNGNEMHLEIYNPRQEQGSHHIGNKIALGNIRERLALQFDVEASYKVEMGKDFYRVHIKLPYVKELLKPPSVT
ncbi:Autolysin sensor kinase [Candidatus Nitrotoga sp. HW29]|uniref:sensor histidine kinase n=1 Tax=Candidatus Nitrotoga sp. HW29 TaxID=2886963 RepID=UPI001EF2BD4C|nr:histidine kinase [Candidatus Nitrotoga sp. HW29]CAH1904512.1 Autolysin sensor kinase [Candidatus Nitrotoga sp. HW29]